jgi:hypothetical protein
MNRDQLREAVLGTAAWKKAGLLNESVAPVQEQSPPLRVSFLTRFSLSTLRLC